MEGQKSSNGAQKFFGFYRDRRKEQFSDSEIVYEIPLTEELFDIQMDLLSTKKMQSQFENFIVAVAGRLITPNIKPQTGPDGGGDGKVDAETFAVSPDISDRWYVGTGGARGEEYWALAISCKSKWKDKVESDVAKIVETKRGYTQVLFFTNQYIKADKRLEVERRLSDQYGIKVFIFDRLWCRHAVFLHGCLDLALSELCFSDKYRNKHVTIGPNDKRRQERLSAIEKDILRPINGLDTDYVDELAEAFILSRNLERPRTETEGRYYRAVEQCKIHGTEPQLFNLIYDHGWTSLFWFEDITTAYQDYLKLKEYVDRDCSVARLEKLTNLKTVLQSAVTMGIVSIPKIWDENEYIRKLEMKLSGDSKRKASHLFLRLYVAEQDLIYRVRQKETLASELVKLKPMLLEAASCLDISFESQYEVMRILSENFEDSPEFDKMLDELSERLSESRQSACAARIRLDRAQSYLDKDRPKEAVRHLSFCVYAFEREECLNELIQSSGLMGLALWDMGLPYSAEAFLIKSACFLVKDYYKNGTLSHMLLSVLVKLCEIELMLGRLVMYLNWHRLLMCVANNANFYSEQNFKESVKMQDASWACRLAAADLSQPIFAKLPDILERAGLFVSSQFLKYTLGYPEDIDEQNREAAKMRNWRSWMLEQPVFEQFLCELNISQYDVAKLETTVNNFTFEVEYPNHCMLQGVAEVLLASVEAMMATDDKLDVVPYHSDIHIQVVQTGGVSEMIALEQRDQYELKINPLTLSDEAFWACVVRFIVYFLARNAVVKEGVETLIGRKQDQERMLDRMSVLQHTRMANRIIFGDMFKHCIEEWVEPSDKNYSFKGEVFTVPHKIYLNHKQHTVDAFRVNQNMDVWEGAGWKACVFLGDREGVLPPVFGLAFENATKAAKIVDEWRRLSAAGKPNVKIFIVRGIDANHPMWYRVCVAPELSWDKEHADKMMLTVCRKHTMTPKTTKNLDCFESQFRKFGYCRLVSCCYGDAIDNVTISKMCSEGFVFSNIAFINAFEIADGTEAVFALEANDNPVIPEGFESKAPVLTVLTKLKAIDR